MASTASTTKTKQPTLSETARERESFKYYDLSTIKNVIDEQFTSFDAIPARSSEDTALTAFAQLGTLRLDARRAMISLFDRKYQYIVAEATKSLSLQYDSVHEEEDGLWLCGSAIPRRFTLCDNALLASDAKTGSHSTACPELPITVLPDLSSDTRPCTLCLCAMRPRMRFYAGIPIRTPAGINIGVYCIFDDKPRETFDGSSAQFLRDMSVTVMKHLESCRSKELSRRGERMVRGLGSFIEGKSTITGWHESSRAFTERPSHDEGVLNLRQQQLVRETEVREQIAMGSVLPKTTTSVTWSHFQHNSWEALASMVDTVPFPARRSSASHSRGTSIHKAPSVASNSDTFFPNMDLECGSPAPSRSASIVSSDLHISSLDSVFSRAANIIRESIEVEGVVFFDASISWVAGIANGVSSHSSARESPLGKKRGESDASIRMSLGPSEACKVLGFATSHSTSVNDESCEPGEYSLSTDKLKSLLQRCPNGRIFSLDEPEPGIGDIDEVDGKVSGRLSNASTATMLSGRDIRQRKDSLCAQRTDGQIILEVLPGARSVVLFPLWDSHRERWYSAGLAWTRKPSRVLTSRDDLSYLMAFGTTIMADIARADVLRANRAKGNVLGSISHELRTPLHGILGGVDMLHNTKIDALQGDIAHTIETCGVTLLDTINHLLDQAKINNLMRDNRRHRQDSGGLPSLVVELDLDVLTEEVVESVYAGHIYQKQALAAAQADERPMPVPGPVLYPSHTASPLKDEAAPWNISPSSAAAVKIILDVGPQSDWLFYADPGSIRRILMNIFGNALKYTDRGFVKVTLRKEELKQEDGISKSNITLTVSDSGKGMSEEFLRTRLYKPFSQEDQLAPGVGLGLSISRQIIASLKGSMEIQSKVGKGTTVSFSFPLEQVELSPDASLGPREVEASTYMNKVAGLRLQLHGFKSGPTLERKNSLDEDNDWHLPIELIEGFCRDWLHMEVLSSDHSQTTIPDLYISTEAGAQELAITNRAAHIRQPVVVICRSTWSASSLSSSINRTIQNSIFEFISQPCSPRKLAKALALCFDRWMQVEVSRLPSVDLGVEEIGNINSGFSTPGLFDATPHSTTPVPPEIGSRSRSSSCKSNFSVQAIEDTSEVDDVILDEVPTYLLVDDNSVNLQLLIAYVKKRKFRYITAMDGLQAYTAYKKVNGKLRCILMDISMPIMDGLESTRNIRNFEQKQGLDPVAIIALTGLASAESQQEAFASGVDHFLTKPVRLKEIDRLMQT